MGIESRLRKIERLLKSQEIDAKYVTEKDLSLLSLRHPDLSLEQRKELWLTCYKNLKSTEAVKQYFLEEIACWIRGIIDQGRARVTK
jgi:hypothetical protein